MMPISKRLRAAVLSLLGVALFSIASPDIAAAAELSAKQQRLLTQLNAESYTQRQAAGRALAAGPYLSDSVLRTMLQAAQSDEQRHRLLTIAEHQTLRRAIQRRQEQDQAGAIGVSHQPLPADQRPGRQQPAVLVVETIPGFPGHAHLEPGDQIIALGGKPFGDDLATGAFPTRIKAHRFGEPVTVTFIRDGQQKTVRFELSAVRALEMSYDPQTDHMRENFARPWFERRAKLLDQVQLTTPLKLNPNGS
jgi:C-terminal processing protease CtpA/Prc